MMHPPEVNVDDHSDVITSHLETAVNLTSHPHSGDMQLSSDILEFLESEGERPEDIISQRIVEVPEMDDTRPLTHYFVSTSHNTYLLGNQLFGGASPSAYTHVLSHHCRCVEIDVWPPTGDSAGDPVVTHGHTFSQHIPFQDVCVAIGEGVLPDEWPVMVSLECHLDVPDQDRIVQIMKEVWRGKLVENPVTMAAGGHVSPRDLRGRIVLMVEYYPPQTIQEAEAEELEAESGHMKEDSSVQKKMRIGPSLAALGVYAHSVKPTKDWLAKDIFEPSHVLYNVSESSLEKLLTSSLQPLITNSLVYMRRVYPKFTRIFSSNLVPLRHWRSGSQVAALNWQRYDTGVQINEAMFVGSGGWVLKPNTLLGVNADGDVAHTTLTCVVVSGCNIPVKSANTKAYVCAELLLSSGEHTVNSHTTASSSPTARQGDYTWKKHCTWEYAEDSMAFVRLSVYCSEYGRDERLGTFCARVAYLRPGWKLVRLFDRKGKHNGGVLLVRFYTERNG